MSTLLEFFVSFFIPVAHIPLIVVVVSEVDISIGAAITKGEVSTGDYATDSQMAVRVGVRAMLEGVALGVAVGATRNGMR